MNSKETQRFFQLLESIDKRLRRLQSVLAPSPRAVKVQFYETVNGQLILKEDKVEIVKAKAKKLLSVKFLDADNNEAEVDGAPSWVTTDDTLVTLAPADDGMSCVIQFLGLVGSGKIQCHADADMTEGAKDIVGEYEFTIVGGEAVVVQITSSDVPA